MVEVANWVTPTRETNLWDRIWLNGEEVPCHRVTVDGFDAGRQLDKKGRKGEDGADYTDNGFRPAEGTILLEWLDAEKAALGESILEKFEPRSKSNVATPVGITHPCPNENGVEQIIIETKGGPKIKNGIRSRLLKVSEYRPAEPKKGAGKGKGTNVEPVDVEEQSKAINDYYDQRAREIVDDVDNCRMSEEDGVAELLENDVRRMEEQQDLYEANNLPASPDNVDANSLS